MARSAIALINPELLSWAREHSRLNLDLVSKKSTLKVERIKNWEEGKEKPTVKQLKKLAKIYNQSFATFYLPKPPSLKIPKIDDFRKFPIHDIHDLPFELTKEINFSTDRREIAIELYNELNEEIPKFTLVSKISDNPRNVAQETRKLLKIKIDEQISWTDSRIAFNSWREAIEKIGVLVFQSSAVSLDTMRGFSLSEFPLPVIGINRKDVYVARIFTLLHELAHIIIHQAGICDIHSEFENAYSKNIEMFCNEFAGSLLVPQNSFLSEVLVKTKIPFSSWDNEDIGYLSKRYHVSREVILRRLLINDRITESFYNVKKEEFQQEFKKKKSGKGFVPPALNVVSLSGKPFTNLVFEAHHKNKITSSTVSEFLGVKSKHFEKIKQLVGIS